MNYVNDLKFVIYTLSTVILALVGAIVFMWRTHRKDIHSIDNKYKKVQDEKIDVAMRVIEATTTVTMNDERQTMKFEQLKESNTQEHKNIIDTIKSK